MYVEINFYSCFRLQKLGQPIQDRYKESEARPKAFDEFGHTLQQVRKAVDMYNNKVGHASKGLSSVCTSWGYDDFSVALNQTVFDNLRAITEPRNFK